MYKNYFSTGFFLFLTALLKQFSSDLLGKDFFVTNPTQLEDKLIPIYIGITSNQNTRKDKLAIQKDVGRRWERDTG